MADNNIKNLKNHGRETYAVYYGDEFVLKRPLPTFNDSSKQAWLNKQHKTKQIIDDIRAIKNPLYNVPAMKYINDDEFQILEERAPGTPLTPDLYNNLSKRQQFEIINSIASFLVDMNELKPIGKIQTHQIRYELKFSRLDNFIENKMSTWFTRAEVTQMAKLRDIIGTFEYETRLAWSHADINSGNVLYDPKTSRISFIDFAETDYKFIYRDIFAPLQIELDIYKRVSHHSDHADGNADQVFDEQRRPGVPRPFPPSHRRGHRARGHPLGHSVGFIVFSWLLVWVFPRITHILKPRFLNHNTCCPQAAVQNSFLFYFRNGKVAIKKL